MKRASPPPDCLTATTHRSGHPAVGFGPRAVGPHPGCRDTQTAAPGRNQFCLARSSNHFSATGGIGCGCDPRPISWSCSTTPPPLETCSRSQRMCFVPPGFRRTRPLPSSTLQARSRRGSWHSIRPRSRAQRTNRSSITSLRCVGSARGRPRCFSSFNCVARTCGPLAT